jgi:hypothetical protein
VHKGQQQQQQQHEQQQGLRHDAQPVAVPVLLLQHPTALLDPRHFNQADLGCQGLSAA